LSQSFEDDLMRTYWGRRPGELPAFFANLLPEGRFKEVLESNLNLSDADDLAFLAAVGDDLPGAVSLRAGLASGVFPSAQDRPEEEFEDGSGGQFSFRFSLAGVQLKFSMIRTDGRLTVPAHGGRGDWIVKVGSSDYAGLAENEFTMLEWARSIGFDVPECRLHDVSDIPALQRYAPPGSQALAIRRYDRDGSRRVHQEDFMQVFGWPPVRDRKYASKYEALASVVRGLLGDEAFDEFVRRLAFVVASGNNDAHLKNWSLLYGDGATPRLAPLYDQVATIVWPRLDRELALKLAGARDFGRVNIESFRRLAGEVGANSDRAVRVAQETISAARGAWESLSARETLPREHQQALMEHWRRVPLLREAGDLGQPT
jgi:serine/threonine-protein kinase HipA